MHSHMHGQHRTQCSKRLYCAEKTFALSFPEKKSDFCVCESFLKLFFHLNISKLTQLLVRIVSSFVLFGFFHVALGAFICKKKQVLEERRRYQKGSLRAKSWCTLLSFCAHGLCYMHAEIICLARARGLRKERKIQTWKKTLSAFTLTLN